MKCGPRIKKKEGGAKKKRKRNTTGDHQACGSEKTAGKQRAKNVTRGKKLFFLFFKLLKAAGAEEDVVGKTLGQRQMLIEGWVFFLSIKSGVSVVLCHW